MRQTNLNPFLHTEVIFNSINYTAISEENENDFAIRLTKEAGVASIPTSAFYKNAKR